MTKPYSQASENNKTFILDVISGLFQPGDRILEIASGTGQHAAYFTARMPGVVWIPSETPDGMPTLMAGLDGESRANLSAPLTLDVCQEDWPIDAVDGVFSANSLHIMPWEAVVRFFAGVETLLGPGGHLAVYGPFKYGGEFTTPSNARFDLWLKERDPRSGVRDFEEVDALARSAGLDLLADHEMPANNQCLVWQKRETPAAT